MVADLIDETKREWRKDKFDLLFPKHEADAICPLLIRGPSSKHELVCVQNEDEKYTVKSGYHLIFIATLDDEHRCPRDNPLDLSNAIVMLHMTRSLVKQMLLLLSVMMSDIFLKEIPDSSRHVMQTQLKLLRLDWVFSWQ
ncbi:hypothetical protein V6N11_056756 [Hibiscus sabdariffa]|uniref:Uncharacterized protein n=1 Tax=Hibiscus sabdariffa TaxID=183260 RepID=A0ABR2T5F6_9ROSI